MPWFSWHPLCHHAREIPLSRRARFKRESSLRDLMVVILRCRPKCTTPPSPPRSYTTHFVAPRADLAGFSASCSRRTMCCCALLGTTARTRCATHGDTPSSCVLCTLSSVRVRVRVRVRMLRLEIKDAIANTCIPCYRLSEHFDWCCRRPPPSHQHAHTRTNTHMALCSNR